MQNEDTYYIFREKNLFGLIDNFSNLKQAYKNIYFNDDINENLNYLTTYYEEDLPQNFSDDFHIIRHNDKGISLFLVPNNKSLDIDWLLSSINEDNEILNSDFDLNDNFDFDKTFEEQVKYLKSSLNEIDEKEKSKIINFTTVKQAKKLEKKKIELFGADFNKIKNQIVNVEMNNDVDKNLLKYNSDSYFIKMFLYIYYSKHLNVLDYEDKLKLALECYLIKESKLIK